MTALASPMKLVRAPVLAWQWCGILLLFLAACVWLQLPDSHTWQFLLSVLTGAAWALLLLWFLATTFARLDANPLVSTGRRMLALALAVLLFYGALYLIGIGREHESLYAGYWNSRLSAHERGTFTYLRLELWQEWFYLALTWVMLALLLPVAFTGAVRRVRLVLTSLTYWIVALVAWTAGLWLTGHLLQWMPGTGPTAQIVSLGIRLLVGYSVAIFLWCAVLASMADAVLAEKTEPLQSV